MRKNGFLDGFSNALQKDHWMEHGMGDFLNLDIDVKKIFVCIKFLISETSPKIVIIEGVEFR